VLITLMSQTPATGLSSYVACAQSAFTSPNAAGHGTGLSIAGSSAAAQAAVFGVRSTDLTGLVPRGAPV